MIESYQSNRQSELDRKLDDRSITQIFDNDDFFSLTNVYMPINREHLPHSRGGFFRADIRKELLAPMTYQEARQMTLEIGADDFRPASGPEFCHILHTLFLGASKCNGASRNEALFNNPSCKSIKQYFREQWAAHKSLGLYSVVKENLPEHKRMSVIHAESTRHETVHNEDPNLCLSPLDRISSLDGQTVGWRDWSWYGTGSLVFNCPVTHGGGFDTINYLLEAYTGIEPKIFPCPRDGSPSYQIVLSLDGIHYTPEDLKLPRIGIRIRGQPGEII